MKFIIIVYPPTVMAGILPKAPASEKDSGSDDMTLLPSADLIHSATQASSDKAKQATIYVATQKIQRDSSQVNYKLKS